MKAVSLDKTFFLVALVTIFSFLGVKGFSQLTVYNGKPTCEPYRDSSGNPFLETIVVL
jgi:hypothetical protein